MFPLTIPQYLRAMPRARLEAVTAWVGPIEQAMLTYEINSPARMAPFLAVFAQESSELNQLSENLNYRPERLLEVFPRHFADLEEARRFVVLGPPAIASRIYADRNGNGPEASADGWTYRGRAGGITFKNNYRACSIATCGDADTLLVNPELLEAPQYGAPATAWWWSAHGCNGFADAGDFDGVCDVWNIGHKTPRRGDANGYADRARYLQAFQRELGITYA